MQHSNPSPGALRAVGSRLPRRPSRWALALLGVAACSLLFAACGSSASSSSTTGGTHARASGVIYVIGYQQNNAFWQTEGEGASQAGSTFGVPVRYEAPATSSDAGMISLIDAAMATHPYGLAIDYTDKTMQAPVQRALSEGIHVVLYNNDRFEAQAGGATTNTAITNLAFVGQDEHHSGSVLGSAFLPYLPKPPATVLIVNPFPGAYVLTLRQAGVTGVLQQAGYKVQQLVVNGNDPEPTVEATIGAYLQAHSNIAGIVGLGDPGASPATRYLQQHHMNISVATFDVDTETYDLMKSGSPEKVALDQQPYLQGFHAVQDLALQEEFGFQPVSVNTGTYIVTPQNLASLSRLVSEGKD